MYSDEFTELKRNVLERQEKMDLLTNQAEKMEQDSLNLSKNTGKLVEKVQTLHSPMMLAS